MTKQGIAGNTRGLRGGDCQDPTAEASAKAGASVIVGDRDKETVGKVAEGLRAAVTTPLVSPMT